MGELYKRHPNTKCVVCGKDIYRRPGVLNENRGKAFCGSMCYGIANRKEIPCVVCGKKMLAGLNKKTCSRKCANIHRAGIKYLGRHLKDKVKTYQSLKKRLVESRGSRCQRCGYDKAEILQIHHQDRDRENNRLKNLELLCPNCHSEEHFLFGKKKLKIWRGGREV